MKQKIFSIIILSFLTTQVKLNAQPYDISISTLWTCTWSIDVYDAVGNYLATYNATGTNTCIGGTLPGYFTIRGPLCTACSITAVTGTSCNLSCPVIGSCPSGITTINYAYNATGGACGGELHTISW
jgi:hypothetical protein